jgi:hypothetical protein
MNQPQRIGVMFDTYRIGGSTFPSLKDETLFPTLDRAVHYSCEDAEPYANWFAIAADPSRMRYFDDDAEAMDETNYDVVVTALGGTPECCNPGTGYSRGFVDLDMSEEIDEAGYAYYHDTFQNFLIVDPNRKDLVDEMVRLRSQLEGYPLLDEDTYSDREHNAWVEYMDNGLRYDTKLSFLDEETAELFDDHWDTVAPAACQQLDYYYGFSGEHGPDFSEAIGRAFIHALITRRPVTV